MQTRRDQLQAYRYLLRRVLAAMLGSEPEAIEQPMRRVTSSTLAGVMVGVLACAGVALYGWIGHANATKWKSTSGALIIEKETNATYLYLPKANLAAGGKGGKAGQGQSQGQGSGATGQVPEKDMMLVQVLNYTSARLILGAAPTVVRVSQHSLDGIARGPRIGIPLAPSAVPSDKNLVSSGWSICSTAQPGESAPPRVDLLVGTPQAQIGARPVGNHALLVKAGDSALTYLLWNGKRLAADDDALRSLRLSPSSAVQVGPAWLDALEAGHPLRAPVIEHRGDRGPVDVDGQETRIGEVFHSPSPDSYYVMLPDGFSEITEVQANLIFGEGTARVGDQVQREATDVAISDVNHNPSKTENLIEPDLPATAPTLPDLGGGATASMCVWYDAHGARRLTTGGDLPPETPNGDTDGAAGANGGSAGDSTGVPELGLADRVLVPPGKAALVGLQAAPGVKPESYFLITEDGVKFPIPDTDVLTRLGYANVDPAQVPGSLLRLIPQGPALTVDAAYRSASFTSGASGSAGG